MNTPTPGPWSIHEIGISEGTAGDPPFRYRDIKIGAGETIIAEVNLMQHLEGEGGYPHVENVDEQDANARLITAAPDLLEALKALGPGSRLDGYCFCRNLEQIAAGHTGECREARAAIAKAEGR